MVEAGGEMRGGVRVRNIGLTDRLSGSDRVCYKGRPGPVERPSEVTCRRRSFVREWDGGESAGGRWRYRASGCVMGTCIHYMRSEMGSGGMYTRQEDHQTAGEEEVTVMMLVLHWDW